jgi:hypothetical protein
VCSSIPYGFIHKPEHYLPILKEQQSHYQRFAWKGFTASINNDLYIYAIVIQHLFKLIFLTFGVQGICISLPRCDFISHNILFIWKQIHILKYFCPPFNEESTFYGGWGVKDIIELMVITHRACE